ncbi:MAG: hypothetical protein ABI536_05745 [Gallionella sp.]
MTMAKIEFIQPNPRVEDWRVKLDDRTIGNVWRAGKCYIADVTGKSKELTNEAAFSAARKQAKNVAAARR